MIVVKCEMWPGGDERKAYPLCKAEIANDGDTSEETDGRKGSYKARFMQAEQFNPKKVWRSSKVPPISRSRRGVWDILYVALRNAGMEERNPE